MKYARHGKGKNQEHPEVIFAETDLMHTEYGKWTNSRARALREEELPWPKIKKSFQGNAETAHEQ
jgi:hypothetical protein